MPIKYIKAILKLNLLIIGSSLYQMHRSRLLETRPWTRGDREPNCAREVLHCLARRVKKVHFRRVYKRAPAEDTWCGACWSIRSGDALKRLWWLRLCCLTELLPSKPMLPKNTGQAAAQPVGDGCKDRYQPERQIPTAAEKRYSDIPINPAYCSLILHCSLRPLAMLATYASPVLSSPSCRSRHP